jgi:hypothetical protein
VVPVRVKQKVKDCELRRCINSMNVCFEDMGYGVVLLIILGLGLGLGFLLDLL